MKAIRCLSPITILMASCTITGYEDRFKIDEDYVESIIRKAPYPDGINRLKRERITEGKIELGLKDALDLFLVNNREYLTELENLFVSRLDMELSEHIYYPVLSPLSVSFARDEAKGNKYGVDENISAGITQRLPTGGSLSLVSRASGDQDKELSTHTYSYSNTVSLTLPILQGAGLTIGLNRLIRDKRAYVYAKREFQDFKENALINVVNNYFNLIQLERRIENFRANLESARKLLQRAQIEYDLGRQRKSEVFRAQVQVTNAETQLQNAIENLNLQRDRFKIDLGLDPSVEITLTPMEINVEDEEIDMQRYVEKALVKNRGWKNAIEQFEDEKRNLYIAYNALLPTLNLTADTTISNTSERPVSKYDEGTRSFSGSLDFTYPLDRLPVNIEFHKNMLAFVQAERTLDLQKDQVVRRAKELVIELRRNVMNVKLDKRAVEEAERNLELVEIEYETGVGNRSSLDIVTAQRDLLNAKNSLESSKVEYIISRLNLKQFITELDIKAEGWYK